MDRPLRFQALMAQDLHEAEVWYDEISPELGTRFRKAVDARLDDIEMRPESFGKVASELHAARVPGFPYLVVFEILRTSILVTGLFHTASDPEKWRARR